MDGRNEYLLSETVLSADLVVNLPKLKTHKKTGVTLALKNLVGINGDKNLLPHHCVGSPDAGRRRVPGRRRARPAAQRRDRGGARAALARDRHAAGALGPARRERRARRRVHPQRQLVRQSDHLAHVPRPEPLPLLQRRARQRTSTRRRPCARVLTRARRRRRGRGRGAARAARRAARRRARRHRPDRARSRRAAPDGLRRAQHRQDPRADAPIRSCASRRCAIPSDVRVFESRTGDERLARARGSTRSRCERVFEPHPGWRGHIERAPR